MDISDIVVLNTKCSLQLWCRNPDKSWLCSLCGKVSRDVHAAKSHLDSKHFPSDNGYNCNLCDKHCKTKNALACHMSQYHRNKQTN